MSSASLCTHLRSFQSPSVSKNALALEEECSQCFENQDSQTGVNICLHCLNPGCENHALFHATARSHFLALNVVRRKVESNEPAPQITKLAIGVPGGAGEQEDKFTFEFKVRCFRCNFMVNMFDASITPAVTGIVSSILAAEPSRKKAERLSWEKEVVACQHTTGLAQLAQSGALLNKALATCNECSINSNLWLCLTCGHLGCGRKNYDGSGGNNHAVEHNTAAHHPVVCKMGTVTPEGTADIYCYACDDTVLDPHLAAHLRHFGIDVAEQTITEKTTTELQLELNLKVCIASLTTAPVPVIPHADDDDDNDGDGVDESKRDGGVRQDSAGERESSKSRAPSAPSLPGLSSAAASASSAASVLAHKSLPVKVGGKGGPRANQRRRPQPKKSTFRSHGAHGQKKSRRTRDGAAESRKSLARRRRELYRLFDFSMTTSDGKPLKPLYGPGLTGLENLGNSCYMASVLQTLFALPAFQQVYHPTGLLNHRATCQSPSHLTCFQCQMEKLGEGLLSGRYSTARAARKPHHSEKDKTPLAGENTALPPSETTLSDEDRQKREELERGQLGVKPLMFKTLIGAEHPEFATMRQQDAFEFFEYFCAQLEQKERVRLGSPAEGRLPTSVFDFALEQRLECLNCHGVRYSKANSNALSVPLVRHKLELESAPASASAPVPPSDKAPPMPKEVAYFEESIQQLAADEVVEFRCPVCGATPAGALKRNRFWTSPDVLVLHAKRFVYENWVPKKLDIDFKVPERIDLSALAAEEAKPSSEQILPDVPSAPSSGPQPSEEIVLQLVSMGFDRVGCEKAALATGNAGAEAAMNWLVEHLEDPDLNVPVAKPQTGSAAPNFDEGAIAQLGDMGFNRGQAICALKETSGNMERAVDWLFSHPEVTGEESSMDTSADSGPSSNVYVPGNKRPPAYRLFGLVTHKGTSVHSGHYVAHVRKGDRWVFFNDNKVAEDPTPPVGGAYLYFFVKE